MNPKVDAYLSEATQWRKEYESLRAIALDCELAEELKWGNPCYTFHSSNIVLIHGFKEYCAFLFFKGVLLKDPKGILVQQTETVQAARQIRFTSVQEIVKLKTVLKTYIREAIEVQKAGLKVELKKTSDFKVPKELKNQFTKNPAFNALTPGRQRAYLLYFSSAKQSITREARVAKYMPKILKGKGLDD